MSEDIDNVTDFPTPRRALNKQLIQHFREVADMLEVNMDTRVAFAIWVDAGNGECAVQGGGFQSDSAALRYLTAFIRNQGFAT